MFKTPLVRHSRSWTKIFKTPLVPLGTEKVPPNSGTCLATPNATINKTYVYPRLHFQNLPVKLKKS
jgi:hypothetical protein